MKTKVECLHAGQKHAYGDSFYEFQVTTKESLSREELLHLCDKKNPFTEGWKTKEEWQENQDSAIDYFAGYCETAKNAEGYYVTYCLPYTD